MVKVLSGELSCPCDRSCYLYFMDTLVKCMVLLQLSVPRTVAMYSTRCKYGQELKGIEW